MSKSDKTDKTPKPMDDSIRERTQGVPSPNRARVAHALKTLVAEMHEVFPETPVEYSNYDRFNAALDVTFDLTGLDAGDSVVFNDLIKMIDGDERVATVLTEDYSQAVVSLHPAARTKDKRDPFGLPAAFGVLMDEDGVVVPEPQYQTVAEGYPAWGGSL